MICFNARRVGPTSFSSALACGPRNETASFKTNDPRGGLGPSSFSGTSSAVAAGSNILPLFDDLPQRCQREATTKFRADLPVYQYTLRRTPTRGATTTPRLATGRATTAAPRAPTQPARYTPRAQTTAFASVVARATKPPTSNRGIIRCFITVLLELRNEARRFCRASNGGWLATRT
jgi:hypothetical protein